jgi:UTP-glucose-1-phosphate uridylyltransferase
MNSSPSLVILAGGLGSRYKGSKQIDVFGEQDAFLLEFAIYDAVEAGFESILLIVNEHVHAEMKSKLIHWESKVELHFVLQELSPEQQKNVRPNRIKPWGTAQALLCAESFIKGPFVVMNADDYYGTSVMKTAYSFFQNEVDFHGLLSYALSETLSEHGGVSRGLCAVDENGFLKNIVECLDIIKNDSGIHCQNGISLSDNDRISMNMWFFQKGIFAYLQAYFDVFFTEKSAELLTECYLPSMVQSRIQDDKFKVKVLSSQEKWVGLTFPEDRNTVMLHLSDLTEQNVYPKSFSL